MPLLPRDAYSWFRYAEQTISVGTGVTEIVSENPDRVVLVISLPTPGSSVNISTLGTVAISTGTVLSADNNPIVLVQSLHALLPQVRWFAISAVITNVTITEVLLERFPTGIAI